MISLMLLALLIGRQALSLRLAITAALFILMISPESLLNVGFQMSFAAVIALVATYEALSPWFRKISEQHQGLVGRSAVYLISVALSTFIAEIAIAPIAAFHFNQFSAYGLFSNMLAVPLTAFWIMPWGAIALLLSPFGLEGYALVPMGQGIELLTQIATMTAAAPGAHIVVPAYPLSAFVLFVIAGLCFTLWRGPMRLSGIALLVPAIATIFMERPPDLLVSPDGKMLAVKGDNAVLISTKRGSGLTKDVWTRRWGEKGPVFWLDAPDFQKKHQIACDDIGCTFIWPGASDPIFVSYANSPAAIAEDCRETTLLITPLKANQCREAPSIIDAERLQREGAQAIYFDDENGISIKSTNAYRGQRPWVHNGS
jgi:competence protein ComEC